MTAAAPTNTIVSALPSNQESTMAAFATQPSYPLPLGARAIMQARNALQGSGARPLYSDPSQLAQTPGFDPGRYAGLMERIRAQRNMGAGGGGLSALGLDYGAPAPGGDVSTMPADASSSSDAGNAAMRNLQAQPGASDNSTFGQAEQDYGPVNQTAPGGVLDGVDLSTPDGWRQRFTMEGMGGARAPMPPRIMSGVRLPNYRR